MSEGLNTALGSAVWMTMYKPSSGKLRKLRSMKWCVAQAARTKG